MQGSFVLEDRGGVVIARVRGEPDERLLRDLHEAVFRRVRDQGASRVLYDALAMEDPPVEVPLVQQSLERDTRWMHVRRAVVVPNSRLAFLARLAFGDDGCRVFYDDAEAALRWLSQPPAS